MSETIRAPRELHGKRIIGFTIGFFGVLLTEIFRGVFIFQFYVYTINLNSILVTIGMAMQLIVSAIFLNRLFFPAQSDPIKELSPRGIYCQH